MLLSCYFEEKRLYRVLDSERGDLDNNDLNIMCTRSEGRLADETFNVDIPCALG